MFLRGTTVGLVKLHRVALTQQLNPLLARTVARGANVSPRSLVSSQLRRNRCDEPDTTAATPNLTPPHCTPARQRAGETNKPKPLDCDEEEAPAQEPRWDPETKETPAKEEQRAPSSKKIQYL